MGESDGQANGWRRPEGRIRDIGVVVGEGWPVLARRVLLVDDHPVFRTGLRRVLESTGRYEIVGEAGNAHEAIRAAEETRPGLILLDVQLPGITGCASRASCGASSRAHASSCSRCTWTTTASSRPSGPGRSRFCRKTSAPRRSRRRWRESAPARICCARKWWPGRNWRGGCAPNCGCRAKQAV